MKKLIALLLVLCLMLSVSMVFTACDDADKDEERSSKNSETKDDDVKDDGDQDDADDDNDNQDDDDTGDSNANWKVVHPNELENFALKFDATFVDGDIGENMINYNVIQEYKIAGTKISIDGEASDDTETIPMLRNLFLKTAQAIKDKENIFTYSAADKNYAASEEITYNVVVAGYDTTITLANAEVELDENGYLTKLTCRMTQAFVENNQTVRFVLETTFTFSDYGTTVVE